MHHRGAITIRRCLRSVSFSQQEGPANNDTRQCSPSNFSKYPPRLLYMCGCSVPREKQNMAFSVCRWSATATSRINTYRFSFFFLFVTRREASSTQRRFQVTRGFLSPARAFIYAGPLLEPRPSEKILAYRTELRTEIALPHLAPR